MTKVKEQAPFQSQKTLMRWMARLLCLLAILSLGLVPAAVAARATHGPVTELVICGDGGAQTIRLDASGSPVAPGQCCDCPDCLTLAADLAAAVPSADVIRCPLLLGSVRARPILAVPQRHLRPVPRGPPPAYPGTDSLSQARLSPAALEFGQVPRGKAMTRTGQTKEVAR